MELRQSKDRLLDTALALMWESGYHSVSVDDICRRADVRKGTFYHFFPSKADLAVAAIDAHWQGRRPALDTIFSPSVSADARFRAYCAAVVEHQREKLASFGKVCGCPVITLGSEQSTSDEKIRAKVLEVVGCVHRYFETAIRDGIADGVFRDCNPKLKATEVFSFVIGLQLEAKLQNSLAPLDRLTPGIFDLLGNPMKAAA